jgi:hypothetical protein
MGCLMEFYTSLILFYYENEFQNPQIFQQTISTFPKHSTLVLVLFCMFCGLKKVFLYFEGTLNFIILFEKQHHPLFNHRPPCMQPCSWQAFGFRGHEIRGRRGRFAHARPRPRSCDSCCPRFSPTCTSFPWPWHEFCYNGSWLFGKFLIFK